MTLKRQIPLSFQSVDYKWDTRAT